MAFRGTKSESGVITAVRKTATSYFRTGLYMRQTLHKGRVISVTRPLRISSFSELNRFLFHYSSPYHSWMYHPFMFTIIITTLRFFLPVLYHRAPKYQPAHTYIIPVSYRYRCANRLALRVLVAV